MTKYICITGGKGGVGKTTTAVNIASCLQKKGHNVVLADANISTPNIHLHLGEYGASNSLQDAMKNKIHVSRAIHKHKSGLKIIPSVATLDNLKYPDYEGVKEALLDLEGFAEIVIIDGAPGFGREALAPIEVADEILIVANPDHASIEGAKKSIEVCKHINKHILGIILNKARKDRFDHGLEHIESIKIPIITTIPHDHKVRNAWKRKRPVVHIHPKSKAAKEFQILADLIGPAYARNLDKKENISKGHLMKNLGLRA